MVDDTNAQVTTETPAATQSAAPTTTAAEPAATPANGHEPAPATPPPDTDAFARKFEKAAQLEAKAREAMRQAEANRKSWEEAAEKRAEEKLVAEYRRDPGAFAKSRGISDKEAASLAQRAYVGASGVPLDELPADVRAQLTKSELEARIERMEKQFEHTQKAMTEAQQKSADIRVAHDILAKAPDDAAFARAEFAANPFEASQEFTRVYNAMNAQGLFIGARNSSEIAKAVTAQYNRIIKDRVEGIASRHGHAMTQTTKTQPKPASAADKADVASVSGPATRPEIRPTTDKEWRELFDKSRKKTRP